MKIVSTIGTKVAYGGTADPNATHADGMGGPTVTIDNGVNEVSDAQYAALEKDSEFKRHVLQGFLVVVADAPVPAVPPLAAVAQPDPRRERKPKESDKAYNARMAQLEDEKPSSEDDQATADAAFVKSYFEMEKDEQDAMFPALSDREKALVAKAPV